MTVLPPALLMLVAWLLWLPVLAGLGLPVARSMARGVRVPGPLMLRASLWSGLSVLLLIALTAHLVMPLGGSPGLLLAAVLWLAGLVSLIVLGRGLLALPWRTLLTPLLLLFAVVLVVVAFWSAGLPTNYDTGLYHLGAIAYTSDYSIIPGLANLHDRFGFNSSMWPLSALLGTGPLGSEGFRLVNGLLMTALLADLALRLMPRRRPTAGTYALAIGMVFAFGAVAQYPGRLVASSAQDTAALLLTLVSTAYLLDYLFARRSSPVLAAVALLTSVAAATVRPLGWIFAAGTALVIVVVMLRRAGAAATVHALWLPAVLSALTLAVMLVRDVFLSGWLLFPLSALPIGVPWQASDPWSASRDITGWARTPFQDVNLTLSDNTWFGGWLLRLPTDWSIPTLGVLLLVLVGLVIWPVGRVALVARWRVILVALVPSVLALLLWFVNAPDPRFAWGYTLALGLIPVAVVLAGVDRWRTAATTCMVVLASLLVLAGARGSFASLAWELVPPPTPEVSMASLADGTAVKVPIVGDQCWSVFPLCRPWYSDSDIVMRGPSIGYGFEAASR